MLEKETRQLQRNLLKWKKTRKELRWIWSVSYTHLDVYKRQVLNLLKAVLLLMYQVIRVKVSQLSFIKEPTLIKAGHRIYQHTMPAIAIL